MHLCVGDPGYCVVGSDDSVYAGSAAYGRSPLCRVAGEIRRCGPVLMDPKSGP